MPDLSKTKVPTATDRTCHLSLDYHHVTTNDFMYMRPVFYRHCLPTEHGKINMMAQCRLAPVAVPTYGRAKMNVRTFFVPYRTIMPNWNEFINDTIGFSSETDATGLVEKVPWFSSETLWKLFSETILIPSGALSNAVESTDNYDFVGTNGSYRKFTPLGKAIYAIFQSLGYRIIPSKTPFVQFNALGLLAFGKVWLDWYSQSAYLDSNLYKALEKLTKISSLTGYELTLSDIAIIAEATWHVNYDGDYFTAAWDSPVAPNIGNYSSFDLLDITSSASVPLRIGNASSSTPSLSRTGGDNGTISSGITQYGIDALKALSDYMKRNQITGARSVDRYLARFGVNLPSEKLDRCIYLGNMLVDINFGDVMSHADTAGTGEVSNLGDYAGRGDGVGNKLVEYDTNGEFGVLLSVASIIPNGGYVQGYDRNNRHLTKSEFWTPEFDALSVQSIERGELYTSMYSNSFAPVGTDYQKTFGFIPTYAEYKVGRSFVTGDYACRGTFVGGDSWHLNRLFDDASFDNDAANIAHSVDFATGTDRAQYNRIFTYTGDNNEHFNCVFHFNDAAQITQTSIAKGQVCDIITKSVL